MENGEFMKKLTIVIGLLACLAVINCTTENTKGNITGTPSNMELVVEPGANWISKMKILLFIYKNNNPQLASWIEDNEGNYILTITISEKSAREKWISAPKEGRPEALPVWSYRQQNSTVTNALDTVTSATIKGSFEAGINRDLLITGNTYSVFLEVNHSYDYNNYWTKNNSGVNGQPSLIYHAQFVAGQQGEISLVPIGHGSVDGSDENIIRELENFTTALSIIQNATVVIK
jgi:hypothetical protein